MLEQYTARDFKFDSKLLSSSHINFFFGAGLNGDAFPQMSGFSKTIESLEKALGRSMENFETDLDDLTETRSERVFNTFKKEFAEIHQSLDYNKKSVFDIEQMFQQVNRLIIESENESIKYLV